MTTDVLAFLQGDPNRIALFETMEAAIHALGESSMDVKKTQISWGNPRKFAFLSLPRQATLKYDLMFTFGLDHQVVHPRIFQAVEPYPNRWTHHVILSAPDDVDETICDWLSLAYHFSLSKR